MSDSPPIFGRRLASGVAPAELQPDGTVVVKDVPLFSEIRETDPSALDGERQVRDRAWLEEAVRRTRARIANGKRPIMTRKHIFDGPERAGDWEPERVELAEVNPEEPPRWTVFGSKRYESVEEFERSKRFDFRSVEISPDAPNEFGALALLRDKEPFFKYPNLREELARVGKVEAFEAEAFRAVAARAPQVWRGRPETFAAVASTALNFEGDAARGAGAPGHRCTMPTTYGAAQNPYAVANAMLNKGQITKAQFDDVVAAIKRESHESTPTKEGTSMPAEEKKEPSIDEKMEAMAAKFMEHMSRHFESLMKEKYAAKAEKHEPDPDPAVHETDVEAKKKAEDLAEHEKKEIEAKKKTEAAQATGGPNDMLPPAVSQLRPGETFGARGKSNGTSGSAPATLTQDEKLELFGLRAWAKRKEAEEKVETFAAEGETALVAAGVTPDAEIRAELRASAKDLGKAGVDRAVAVITRYAKNAARAPEAFGALGQFVTGGAPGADADLKKAVETFGARSETKALIHELYAGWREQPEHFRRTVPFFAACEGNPNINPAIHGDRGGLARKGA